jgi:DNA-binding response OmpR family regulator
MSLSPVVQDHDAMRILVVKDQRALADRIREGLRDQGMAVDVAYDGADALRAVAITRYDVVVLEGASAPSPRGCRSNW